MQTKNYLTINLLPHRYVQFKQELQNASLASQVQVILNLSLYDARAVLQPVPSWKPYEESYSHADLEYYFRIGQTFAVAHVANDFGCYYYHTEWENPHPAHEEGSFIVQHLFGSNHIEDLDWMTSDFSAPPCADDHPNQKPCVFLKVGNCYCAPPAATYLHQNKSKS